MSSPITFWTLPRELQLYILESLPLSDYVNFALSAYYHLRISFPDYFPAVIPPRLHTMHLPPPAPDPLRTLPNEMIINISRYIDRRYLLRWVFAHYYTLANSNPPLLPGLSGRNSDQMILSWLRLDKPSRKDSDGTDGSSPPVA